MTTNAAKTATSIKAGTLKHLREVGAHEPANAAIVVDGRLIGAASGFLGGTWGAMFSPVSAS